MPSLRRTRSAPASRRTQYSHSCPASSTSHTPATRAGSRPPRRPSGSQTSERRVLADLDLWRVEASQREVRGLSSWEPLRASSPTSSEEDELDQEELVPSGSSRSPSPTPSSPITTHNILGGSFSSSWDSLPGAGLSFLEDSSSLHLSFALASPAIPEPLETVPVTPFASMSISATQTSRPAMRRTPSVSSTFSDDSFFSDLESSYVAPSRPSFSDFGFDDLVSSPFDDDDETTSAPAASIPSLGAPSLGRSSSSLSWLDDAFEDNRVPDENHTVEPSSPFSASWFNQNDLFN